MLLADRTGESSADASSRRKSQRRVKTRKASHNTMTAAGAISSVFKMPTACDTQPVEQARRAGRRRFERIAASREPARDIRAAQRPAPCRGSSPCRRRPEGPTASSRRRRREAAARSAQAVKTSTLFSESSIIKRPGRSTGLTRDIANDDIVRPRRNAVMRRPRASRSCRDRRRAPSAESRPGTCR